MKWTSYGTDPPGGAFHCGLAFSTKLKGTWQAGAPDNAEVIVTLESLSSSSLSLSTFSLRDPEIVVAGRRLHQTTKMGGPKSDMVALQLQNFAARADLAKHGVFYGDLAHGDLTKHESENPVRKATADAAETVTPQIPVWNECAWDFWADSWGKSKGSDNDENLRELFASADQGTKNYLDASDIGRIIESLGFASDAEYIAETLSMFGQVTGQGRGIPFGDGFSQLCDILMENGGPAWYTKRSRTTGELYYVHDATGESQFEPPELPSGWSIGISTTTGYVYYVNAVSGERQFAFPLAVNEPNLIDLS